MLLACRIVQPVPLHSGYILYIAELEMFRAADYVIVTLLPRAFPNIVPIGLAGNQPVALHVILNCQLTASSIRGGI